jgi:hypothetical protein
MMISPLCDEILRGAAGGKRSRVINSLSKMRQVAAASGRAVANAIDAARRAASPNMK